MQNDDIQPATKGDIRNFATKDDLKAFATRDELQSEIQKLSMKMDKGFARVEASIDQVLTVVVNMNKRFGGQVDDHERRITRLERKVG